MKWYLVVAGLGIVGIGIVYGSQIAKKIEEAKFKGGFGLPFDFSSLFETYRGLQSQMIGKVKEIISGGQEVVQTVAKTVYWTETKTDTRTSAPPPETKTAKSPEEKASEVLQFSTAKPTPTEVAKVYFATGGQVWYNPFLKKWVS